MTQDIAPLVPVADGLTSRAANFGAPTTTIMRPRQGSITSSCSSDDDSTVPSSRPTSGERRAMTASNLNLAAGRRKLEEFKRKKALALAKKTQTGLSEEKKFEYAEAKLGEAREEIQSLREELRVATSIDDRISNERAAMEREKAALLGEVVGLRSTVSSLEEQLDRAMAAAAAAAMPAVEAAAVAVDESSHAAAIELLRDEISTMTNRAEGLEQALFESRKALDALAEEKAGLEEQLQELTVKLAVPSGPFAETPAQTTHQGQGENQGPEQEQDHENDPDWRESELVSLRAELEMARASLGTAIERNYALEEEVEESRENIDSLRELLAEGEAERVELVSSMEELRLNHGQLVGELNGQLEAARMESSQWKNRAENAEAAAPSHRGSMDLAFNPQSSSPSESALRMRLAKAEAAVEAERQAYFSLEEKSRQWQEALDENVSLRKCVTELRESENAMQQYIESLQHGAVGSHIEASQHQEARIQEMQADLDESSQTIARLSNEVNELVARLKAREAEERNAPATSIDVAAGFDHVAIDGPAITHPAASMPPTWPPQDPSHHQGQIPPPVPIAAPTAPAAPAFPPPPSFPPQDPASAEEAASLFDLIDQGPASSMGGAGPPMVAPLPPAPLSPPMVAPMVAPMAPPPTQFSMPGAQTAALSAPQQSQEVQQSQQSQQAPELSPQPPLQPPLQPHLQPNPPSPSQYAQSTQQTNSMPWSIPAEGSEPLPSPTTTHPAPPERKPVGFWAWIAGADRVVENQ